MPSGALTKLVLVSGGLIVWSACFVVLYGMLSVGCMAGTDNLSIWLVVLWIVHVAVLAAALLFLLRDRKTSRQSGVRPFLIRLGCQLTIVGGFATLWIGFPILMLPPCP